MRNRIKIVESLSYFAKRNLSFVFINLGKLISDNYYSSRAEFIESMVCDFTPYARNLVDNAIKKGVNNIVFSNIGILMEEYLGINASKFFLDYAKEYEIYILKEFSINNASQIAWAERPVNTMQFNQNVLQIIGDEDEIL